MCKCVCEVTTGPALSLKSPKCLFHPLISAPAYKTGRAPNHTCAFDCFRTFLALGSEIIDGFIYSFNLLKVLMFHNEYDDKWRNLQICSQSNE